MRASATTILSAALLGGLACVKLLPLENAPCPCPEGYCCAPSVNKCVAGPPDVVNHSGAERICRTDVSPGTAGLGGNAGATGGPDANADGGEPGAAGGAAHDLEVRDAEVEARGGHVDADGDAGHVAVGASDADGGDARSNDADGGDARSNDADAGDARSNDADASEIEACPKLVRARSWRTMSTVGAPRLANHKAVWTGREMLVWGTAGETTIPATIAVGRGARYDPTTDRWTDMSTVDQPAPGGHAAVWLERTHEMMIWGGVRDLGIGALYNPATNTWRAISRVGAPLGRIDPVAVATGPEAIVWCGRNTTSAAPDDGAVYDPVTDRWRHMTAVGASGCVSEPAFAWTGRELVVYGGIGAFTGLAAAGGGLYDPVIDQWRPFNGFGETPPGRAKTAAVFGAGAFVFNGGATSEGDERIITDGARYDDATGTWEVLLGSAETGPLYGYSGGAWVEGGTLGCRGAAAFWGGQKVVAGAAGNSFSDSGSGLLYFPDADRWEAMPALGAPTARDLDTVVSTGATIIVWGGAAGSATLNTGAIYTP